MRDEYYGRIWAEQGREFSAAIVRFLRMVRDSLALLNEIQFEAPWRRNEGVRF